MTWLTWTCLFVRDMVESFELEVPFVRTDDNIADFFTKPFKGAKKFLAMRAIRRRPLQNVTCASLYDEPGRY